MPCLRVIALMLLPWLAACQIVPASPGYAPPAWSRPDTTQLGGGGGGGGGGGM